MRIGEIIETSTIGFWAESEALHALPPLGSLVEVSTPEGGTLVGVVAFGQTTGIDEGRRAVRRGDADTFDGAIYDRHPELLRILRTTFRVVTIGYRDTRGTIRHHLPPLPPPLHYSVSRCDEAMTRAFTTDPRYFPLLLAGEGEVAPEQLLAAHIRTVTADRGGDEGWRAGAGRQIARLLKRDYDRLLTVLEAIDPGHDLPPTKPLARVGAAGHTNGSNGANGANGVSERNGTYRASGPQIQPIRPGNGFRGTDALDDVPFEDDDDDVPF